MATGEQEMTPEIRALQAGLDLVEKALRPAPIKRRPSGVHSFTIFDDEKEQRLTIDGHVSYYFTKGERDVPYLRNGDPGYPGSPPEVEFFDPVVEAIHVSLGGHEFSVDLQHNTPKDLRDMGDDAWGMADETEEANRVIEYEEEHAREGRED